MLTYIRNFVTRITNFVTHITNLVIKNIIYGSKKFLVEKKKYLGGSKISLRDIYVASHFDALRAAALEFYGAPALRALYFAACLRGRHAVGIAVALGEIGGGGKADFVGYLPDGLICGKEQGVALLQTQAAHEFHGGIVGEGLDFAIELGAFHAHLRGNGIDAQFGAAHLSLEDFE